MPLRAPTLCNYPGCGRHAAARGYCSTHVELAMTRYDNRRGKTKERGYGGRWRKVRAKVLAREPLCRDCGKPAMEVDHIIAIRDGGPKYDLSNLAPLCHRCHMIKHRGKL